MVWENPLEEEMVTANHSSVLGWKVLLTEKPGGQRVGHDLATEYAVVRVFCIFPGGAVVKNLPVNAGDTGDVSSILGSGRVPEIGNGKQLQYACLGNSMDSGAWQVIVHRVAKSPTQLSMHT